MVYTKSPQHIWPSPCLGGTGAASSQLVLSLRRDANSTLRRLTGRNVVVELGNQGGTSPALGIHSPYKVCS